ncbi:restriction endonuclease subunit S [bacterium]|nr:restriction endonuclease subunit S [bacterium]
MEGWTNLKLGEVLKLEYGKPLPKERRSDNGAFPAYGANGIKCRTNDVYWEKSSIVVGRKGSAGEINLADGGFWPLDVTYFVVFDEDEYDLRFLYYLLSQLNLPSLAKGVKPGLNRNDVYAIEQHFPPLPEQERIVAILDEAFAAIATATANAEKNLANARELFESQLDAVASSVTGYPHELINEFSVDFNRGRSRHRPRNEAKLYGGDYPFVQTGDIRGSNHWVHNYKQTYSEAGLLQSKLWPTGTVCITIAANIAETGILTFAGCFPDSIIGVVVDEERMSNEFLEYMLQAAKSRLQREGEGAAQDNINLGTFKSQKFPVPPLTKQIQLVKVLNSSAEAASHLDRLARDKFAHLADLKQSLLHKAFTGELTADAKAADRSLSEAGV